MAIIDAVPILKQNIIALDKCPTNYRNLWRLALTEGNQAGQSDDEMIRKGAEITLALLPNMLLRAPSALEQNMSTRQKMDFRFSKFFSGQWTELLKDITLSSVKTSLRRRRSSNSRSYVFSQEVFEERQVQ